MVPTSTNTTSCTTTTKDVKDDRFICFDQYKKYISINQLKTYSFSPRKLLVLPSFSNKMKTNDEYFTVFV